MMLRKLFVIMVAFTLMSVLVYIPAATEVKAAGTTYYVGGFFFDRYSKLDMLQ